MWPELRKYSIELNGGDYSGPGFELNIQMSPNSKHKFDYIVGDIIHLVDSFWLNFKAGVFFRLLFWV
jgi:hypothetical protein